MDFLRRSLKAYMIAFTVYIVLSLLLACIINFSRFRTEWTFAGLILILSVSALLLGMMQGAAAGKRGIIIGMVSAMLFTVIIVTVTGCVFADSFEFSSMMLFYILPVIMGAAGGIAGVGKSSK